MGNSQGNPFQTTASYFSSRQLQSRKMEQTTETTTTVVVQQPAAFPQPLPFGKTPTEFTTPMHACCDDCEICWCTILCPCCVGCQLAGAMHENCCVPTCTAGGVTAMRTRLRYVYGIDGTLCADACLSCWCYHCVICQMAREMR